MTPIPHIIADILAETPVEKRGQVLREVLAYAAAGLVALEGEREAAEAVWRVADAVVELGQAQGVRHG